MPENHTEKDHDRASCPNCLSKNIYGMSRVVGYYSIIENWNDSKKAELKDRRKGIYKLGEKAKVEIIPQLVVPSSQKARISAE